MTGFKDEGEVWNHIRKHMRGKWERCEAIMPAGIPDAFGTFGARLHWLERKVCPVKNVRARMEPSQLEFFRWMERSAPDTRSWVVVGSPLRKEVTFFAWPDLETPAKPTWYNGDCRLSTED